MKKRKVATYTITIENDGNAAFDKVYVKDTFPPSASFIEPSSLRPKVITDTYANWTLQNLPIGSALNITLKLDVTKYAPVELVNRVDACGVYDDETVCARNFSALEINWLTCCIVPEKEQLSVVKTAEVDETNSSVVRYKIEITNWEDATRVATVTDRLPAGMKLIESSIPFATYEDGVVVWNLIEIPASGTATSSSRSSPPATAGTPTSLRWTRGPLTGPSSSRSGPPVSSMWVSSRTSVAPSPVTRGSLRTGSSSTQDTARTDDLQGPDLRHLRWNGLLPCSLNGCMALLF